MINSSRFLEKFLQNYRFRAAKPYLVGDVLDFGGNEGELRRFVKDKYMAVNYDHSPMEGKIFDTVVCLAVIEHIEVGGVYKIFEKFKWTLEKDGRIFLTTPTKAAKPVLDFLAWLGVVDKENIAEHKHYWSKKEIFNLAEQSGFKVKRYKKFQFGFNQLAVLEHNLGLAI